MVWEKLNQKASERFYMKNDDVWTKGMVIFKGAFQKVKSTDLGDESVLKGEMEGEIVGDSQVSCLGD